MLINVGGISYNVKIDGNDSLPPVILLHGFTGDHTTWESLKETLKGLFQVITIDLIGHGKTDSPKQPERYEVDRAAKDIIDIMDHLQLDTAHLLGYSMGGRLALSIALKYPDKMKSLMLESVSPGLKTKEEKEARVLNDEALATRILDHGIINFVHYWENIPLFQTQKKLPVEIQNQIRAQRLQNNPIGLANSLRGFGTGRQPSWWPELNKLDIPVLLMCGKLDEKFCKIAAEMNQLLPESAMIEFNAAGHAIHVEQPNKFDTIVKEFLIEQERI